MPTWGSSAACRASSPRSRAVRAAPAGFRYLDAAPGSGGEVRRLGGPGDRAQPAALHPGDRGPWGRRGGGAFPAAIIALKLAIVIGCIAALLLLSEPLLGYVVAK